MNSLVLQRDGVLYRRSAAVVRILWGLGGFWKFLGGLLWLVPLPLRDLGYRAVSASRYHLWGKKETCRIPTADERSRFLD
jgi:predicted DCC family thiol-disulfide oxidoreductase YuxK